VRALHNIESSALDSRVDAVHAAGNESSALVSTNPEETAMSAIETTPATGPVRYLQPGWFTQHVANPAVRGLARLGLSPKGLRELQVVGRSSGEMHTVPVNLLEVEGHRYLVAPRGTTQWVRNIRVSGGGHLRIGRQREAIAVTELDDADKAPVLREYLRRWRSEVKVFFEGIDVDATDEQLAEIAPGFPVFEVGAVA
jgi:deazaflavin-dependent oxidoreductase (nitroreductase family)